MKVAYIYRKKNPHGFSLERVFQSISGHLRGAEVVEYVMRGRTDLLADVRAIRRLDADIYHVTGDINYVTPLLPRGKTVLTIQDIGHYLQGLTGFKRWLYGLLWVDIPVRTATMLTCSSSETEMNLEKHFDIPAGKLRLIVNCITAEVSPSDREFNADCPMILQVGTKPYKNVPRLVRALQGIPCKLVVVGLLDEETRQALAETGVVYENPVGVSDTEMVALYGKCDIVAFVSTGEGFGLPILEAQAAGKPLVTAGIDPMRSVAGSGACLADPLEIADIRRAVMRLIENSRYRKSVVEAGLRNVEGYRPQAVADEFYALYRDIVKNGGGRV